MIASPANPSRPAPAILLLRHIFRNRQKQFQFSSPFLREIPKVTFLSEALVF